MRKAIITSEQVISRYSDGEPKEIKELTLFTFPCASEEAFAAFEAERTKETNKSKALYLWYCDDHQVTCLAQSLNH